MSAYTPTDLTVTAKGLVGLRMRETGTREWVTNIGKGSPLGYYQCFGDWHNNHWNPPVNSVATGSSIEQTYAWGTSWIRFLVHEKSLQIDGGARNTSQDPITNLDVNIGKIDFPKDYKADSDLKADCRLAPGYCSFDASSTDIPCFFCFWDIDGWQGTLIVGSENNGANALYIRGVTLQAGKEVHFGISLDFFTTKEEAEQVRFLANSEFSETYPQTSYARDIRGIGQIYLVTGTGGSAWVTDPVKWANNPRGWLGDSNINVMTPEGKSAWKTKMTTHFQACVKNAEGLNLQGFVFWDQEGQQHVHGSSVYYGHPAWLKQIAPEMDEVIEELVGILTKAGYDIGFCLRHNQMRTSTDPKQAFYNAPWPNQDSLQAAGDLHHQIAYCQSRFGKRARIYYVDSNTGSEVFVYEQLQELHPDCLIFPESFTVVPRMYAYQPQYQTGRSQPHVRQGVTTQQQFLDIYPKAQSLVNLADVPDNQTNEDQILAGMKRGDIYMVRIWWSGGSEYALYKRCVQRAISEGWSGLSSLQA